MTEKYRCRTLAGVDLESSRIVAGIFCLVLYLAAKKNAEDRLHARRVHALGANSVAFIEGEASRLGWLQG